MASHDHDAGSRGRTEPRDPSRGRTAAPLAPHGPGPYAGPGWDPLPPPPPPPGPRDFLRRKSTQIVGAALAGLVVGGILGGGAVALTGALRDGPRAPAERVPAQPYCYQAEGRVVCQLQPEPPPTRTG